MCAWWCVCALFSRMENVHTDCWLLAWFCTLPVPYPHSQSIWNILRHSHIGKKRIKCAIAGEKSLLFGPSFPAFLPKIGLLFSAFLYFWGLSLSFLLFRSKSAPLCITYARFLVSCSATEVLLFNAPASRTPRLLFAHSGPSPATRSLTH